MAEDCPKSRKEEVKKYGQAGEDAQIQLNLAEEDTYSNVEGFDWFLLGFKETIKKPETIDYYIKGIKRCILRGTDKHSFLNKENET